MIHKNHALGPEGRRTTVPIAMGPEGQIADLEVGQGPEREAGLEGPDLLVGPEGPEREAGRLGRDLQVGPEGQEQKAGPEGQENGTCTETLPVLGGLCQLKCMSSVNMAI